MKSKSTSYWNDKGRYQSLYDKLSDLMPDLGECDDADGRNKHLDRLRRAANCYYDLFNNGLCNRAKEFGSLFRGVGRLPRKWHQSWQRTGHDFDLIKSEGKVDAVIDKFILKAAKEQGML